MKKYAIIFTVTVCIGLAYSFRPTVEETWVLSKEKLGEKLFFDPILSENYKLSCASCHIPEFAFSDTAVFSLGTKGKRGIRNTPSIMNMASREAFFYDGRAATLEDQVLFPIRDSNEMNLPIPEAIRRLKANKRYRQLFKAAFNELPNKQNLGEAIAAYERTLETADTPNDRWVADEPRGMTASQIRGGELFRTKAKCVECHFTPDFTGDEFRAIGLFNGKQYNDSGRYLISRNAQDIGTFKVPGLRNVAMTAPYMHDGSMNTLMEVIEYYDNPTTLVPDAINRDSLLRDPLHLSAFEKMDLEAFLHALTDDRFVRKR